MNFSSMIFETAVQPALAAAGEAASSTSGDGIAFALGGGAVGAIATLVGSWLKSRRLDPLRTEQTQQQALWKENARDHTDIFDRLRKVEADVAGHSAAILGMKDLLNKIYEMVQKLYTREAGK